MKTKNNIPAEHQSQIVRIHNITDYHVNLRILVWVEIASTNYYPTVSRMRAKEEEREQLYEKELKEEEKEEGGSGTMCSRYTLCQMTNMAKGRKKGTEILSEPSSGLLG